MIEPDGITTRATSEYSTWGSDQQALGAVRVIRPLRTAGRDRDAPPGYRPHRPHRRDRQGSGREGRGEASARRAGRREQRPHNTVSDGHGNLRASPIVGAAVLPVGFVCVLGLQVGRGGRR